MGFVALFLITLIPVHVGLMFFFRKAGKSPGMAWIPIYNYFIFARLAGRPWYWVLGLLMPGLNLIVFFALVLAFFRALGVHKGKELFQFSALYPYYTWKIANDPNYSYVPKTEQVPLKASKAREYFEAAMFAFVVAQGIKTYIGEPFHIPTSSMEDQLLVGDLVVVSKLTFGARVPETPLTFPLMHNSFIFSPTTWAYLEWWKGPKMRLPGFRKLERNDVLVFSFPVNDSMVVDDFLKAHSYYDQVYRLAQQQMENNFSNEAMRNGETAVAAYIKDRKKNLSQDEWEYYVAAARKVFLSKYAVRAMPVDKRENFIKRCTAVPGDTLHVIDGIVHIDGKVGEQPEKLVYAHMLYQKSGTHVDKKWMIDQGVSREDMADLPLVKLTLQQAELLRSNPQVDSVVRFTDLSGKGEFQAAIYPNNPRFPWTQDNYGPLWIPQKGKSIALTEDNVILYRRCIEAYENHSLELKEGKVYIDGVLSESYTFERDYYFAMGDNRHGSLDSRFWGFVPDNHVVGTSFIVLASMNKDKSGFFNKVRWNRFFYFPK
jgi:signal peptidase I